MVAPGVTTTGALVVSRSSRPSMIRVNRVSAGSSRRVSELRLSVVVAAVAGRGAASGPASRAKTARMSVSGTRSSM